MKQLRDGSRMAYSATRIRFYDFPYSQEVFDSRIERFGEVTGPRRSTEIQMDLRVLRPLGESEVSIEDGHPWEVMRGELVPYRLRFSRAAWVRHTGYFDVLDTLPQDHHARRLFEVLPLRLPGQAPYYLFSADVNTPGHELALRAAECTLEPRPGRPIVVEVRRRWAWRPPRSPGLVSVRAILHHRYGGDPVAIRLGRRLYCQRLFIGGLHHQFEMRPLVDHVLNLCGDANPWLVVYGMHPQDRIAPKGEMVDGMRGDDLLAEAEWVAERLRAGRRVLVHCWAGINRSASVCCAALILLEGLSADEALARVRERHLEAAPDPYHWFLLRWLASARAPAAPVAMNAIDRGAPLREIAAIR
jgi:hypothetical protein